MLTLTPRLSRALKVIGVMIEDSKKCKSLSLLNSRLHRISAKAIENVEMTSVQNWRNIKDKEKWIFSIFKVSQLTNKT